MAERTITLKLTIDPSGAITAVNDVVSHAAKAGNALETPFANIAARGFAIKAVIDGVTASFGEWIAASNAAEIAKAKLEQAIRGAGGSVEAETAAITAYASARQNATGIDDDATVAVAAMLRAMNLQGDQLNRAIDLTQDLSTLMNGDMNGAVRVIADAFNGNTGMLKRYVKGLDESDIKQRGTISIIEQLTKAVGGQAEAVGNTGAGGFKKFGASVDDVKQAFGDVLKSAIVPFLGLFTQIMQAIVAAPRPIQVMVLGVTTLAGAFVLLGTSMGGLPFIIGGIITGGAALVSFFTGGLEPATVKTSSAIEQLRNRLAELKREAGDTPELAKLRGEIEALLNPVTELTLTKELEAAKQQADEAQRSLEQFQIQKEKAYSPPAQISRSPLEGSAEAALQKLNDLGNRSEELAKEDLETLDRLESVHTAAMERMTKAELELQKFRIEAGKKRAEQYQSTLDAQLQSDLERGKKLIELTEATDKFIIDTGERQSLAHATSEDEKLLITRQAALDRIEAEEAATLAILGLEERLLRARRESAAADERVKIDRRLETIGVERTVVTTTTAQRRESVEIDFTISQGALALPGTVRELEEEIRRDAEAMGNARTREEAQVIRRRIEANQAALDAMKKSDQELLADQRAMNEERKRLWAEQHGAAMAAISGISAGVATAWSEIAITNRQAKDGWDAVWLSIQRTTLLALGRILQAEIEHAIISVAVNEGSETAKTAATEKNSLLRIASSVAEGVAKAAVWAAELVAFIAKEAAMTAVAVAQTAIRIAATLAEVAAYIAKAVAAFIASLGPFGLFAAAGAIALGITVLSAIKKAFGFDRGGRLKKGDTGFFEGNRDEIIAPEEDFKEMVKRGEFDSDRPYRDTARDEKWLTLVKWMASAGPFGLLYLQQARDVLGLARGGQVDKDQRGYIEGGQQEIIAPRRTFDEIMRTEIVPMIVRTTQLVTLQQEPRLAPAGAGYDFGRLEKEIRGLRSEFRRKDLSMTLNGTRNADDLFITNVPRAARKVNERKR